MNLRDNKINIKNRYFPDRSSVKISIKWISLVVLIIVNLFSFCEVVLAGVWGEISGKVVDSDTEEPLEGVNIIIEETYMSTTTGRLSVIFSVKVK